MPDTILVKLNAEEIRRALLEEAKNYHRHNPWQSWEDEILKEFHRKVPYHVLSNKLGRTIGMISHRVQKLGLTQKESDATVRSHSRKTEATHA